VFIILILELFIAFFISYYLQYRIIGFSKKKSIAMRDEKRLKSKNPKPRLGGMGVFFGFSLSIYITLFLLLLHNEKNIIYLKDFNFVFLSLFIIFIIGFLDDLIGLNAFQKLPFELLSATIMYFSGWAIKIISLPFSPYNLILNDSVSYLITILWIVGITNALNLIDGIDGLAGGITMFSLFSFAIIEIMVGKPEYLVLIIPMLGAILGFLKYNMLPAKIYLGDSGSLTIGFFLAILSLKISIKASFGISFLIPISILFIPIFDTTLAFFRRILNGKNPLMADNEHIHHKLLKKGYSEKKVFYTLMFLDFIFSLLAIASVFFENSFRIILLLILIVVAFIMIIYLNYIKVSIIKR
jgi:UDP-GlcNAc:undecaprenyl-phosphate GlcNAc-1-phosphate transferase